MSLKEMILSHHAPETMPSSRFLPENNKGIERLFLKSPHTFLEVYALTHE